MRAPDEIEELFEKMMLFAPKLNEKLIMNTKRDRRLHILGSRRHRKKYREKMNRERRIRYKNDEAFKRRCLAASARWQERKKMEEKNESRWY